MTPRAESFTKKAARHFGDGIIGASSGEQAPFIAFSIARSLRPGQAPTVEMLRDKFGMSRATAYRYRAAWLAANGQFDFSARKGWRGPRQHKLPLLEGNKP